MKIIQKKVLRSGNLKYTTAKAEMIEIAILPSEMPSAMIMLFISIVDTGAAATPTPSNSTVR